MAAPRSCADGLARGLQVVQPRAKDEGERGAEEEVIEVARGFLDDPGPLLVIEHGAVALLQYAPRSRVHHDETDPAEVAVVAPARTGDLAVRPVGELAQDAGRVLGLLYLLEEPVLLQLPRGEVAEVLVDPVGYESPYDALLPPRRGAHLTDPGLRGVPVVVDVVVVEDHRRRHGREEPPGDRVPPGVPVQARVLLEVGDLLARPLVRVAPRTDEIERALGDLVGVDLIPQQ